jgi:hypothetical protein
MYFSSYLDSNSATAEFVNVEVSTNGGTSWIVTPVVNILMMWVLEICNST